VSRPQVQKGLSDYLETKRQAFARFYFLSNEELLEILSQTKDPRAVQPHLRKCFEAINRVDFQDDLAMTCMYSGENEKVEWDSPVYPEGNVEYWLTDVEKMMRMCARLAPVTPVSHRPPHPPCIMMRCPLAWLTDVEKMMRIFARCTPAAPVTPASSFASGAYACSLLICT
jgi:hypothetical protein